MGKCDFKEEKKLISLIKIYLRKKPLTKESNKEKYLEEMEKSLEGQLNKKSFELLPYIEMEDSKIEKLLSKAGVLTMSSSVKADVAVVSKTNSIDSISSYTVNDLFHGIDSVELFFEQRTDRLIGEAAFIGGADEDNYVSNSIQVDKNLHLLKNELFKNIQNALISKGWLPGIDEAMDLLTEDLLLINDAYYKQVMQAATNYFIANPKFSTITSHTHKIVPNIIDDLSKDDFNYKMYSDLIFLSNFDSVINNRYSHMVTINSNYLNEIEGPLKHDKYVRVFSPKTTMYFTNDNHSEEGVNTGNFRLSNMFINMMQKFNNDGSLSQYYLDKNDFYLLAAKIADFELKYGNKLMNDSNSKDGFEYLAANPEKRFKWYLKEIVKAVRLKPGHEPTLVEHFREQVGLVLSIDTFLSSDTLGIPKKEANSDLTISQLLAQTLINNFGATYHVYNSKGVLTKQEMYSKDFNHTGMQNTTFSSMKKHATKQNFYNLSDIDEAKKFGALFDGISMRKDMIDVIYTNADFYKRVNEYIKDKLGIRLNKATLIYTMDNMTLKKGRSQTVSDFRASMENMMGFINQDFSSTLFTDKLDQFADKAANFDGTVKKYLPNLITDTFYKSMLNGYLSKYPVKSITTIKTSEGDSIPAYKLANMTYMDMALFLQQRKYEQVGGNNFKSLLLKNIAAIKGTSTRLEVINGDKSKSAGKMIALESFISDFQYDFLESLISGGGGGVDGSFSVLLGSYSDKKTILSKIFNANWGLDGKEPFVKMPINDLTDVVRNQGRAYYTDTITDVFKSYTELFKSAGIEHKEFSLINNNVTKDFDRSVKELNILLDTHDLKDIIKIANRPDIHIMEELHYSRYGNKIQLNQVLFDNYKIFSNNTLFKKFVSIQEESLLNRLDLYQREGRSVDDDSQKVNTSFNKITREHVIALGIDIMDYGDDLSNLFKAKVNNELNPLLKKWLWMNALGRNEYLYISTKGEYMHSHNKEGKIRSGNSSEFDENYWNSYREEVGGRVSVMSKRNVTNTAVIKAPLRNSKKGILDNLNIAAMDDLTFAPYSINGERAYELSESLDPSIIKSQNYAQFLQGLSFEQTNPEFTALFDLAQVTYTTDKNERCA